MTASVLEAAASGDRRALLLAIRERVAAAVDNPKTPARELAALTRRLMDIAEQLDAMDAATDPPDSKAAKLRAMRAGIAEPDETFDPAEI